MTAQTAPLVELPLNPTLSASIMGATSVRRRTGSLQYTAEPQGPFVVEANMRRERISATRTGGSASLLCHLKIM